MATRRGANTNLCGETCRSFYCTSVNHCATRVATGRISCTWAACERGISKKINLHNLADLFIYCFLDSTFCLGDIDVLKLLLEYGADPNEGDSLPIVKILKRIKSGSSGLDLLQAFLSASTIKVPI